MTSYEPPYSLEQLNQYVERINLPTRFYPSNSPPLDIHLLRALHVCQISSIPYENLDLHYSQHHSISLEPEALYEKLVLRSNAGRGGYCMENSLLLLGMLRSYGFDVYPTGVRIRLRENGVPTGKFVGLVHIVLIITFEDGARFISDVAFGGDGPTTPLPLLETNVTLNLGTQENRYIYDTIPQNSPRKFSTPQKYWIYQYRNSPKHEWNSFYCFTESEFLIGDFNVMNWYTSAGKTFQRTLILVIKFLRADDELKINGKIMLVNDVVKRNMGGKTEVVQLLRSEDDRTKALKEWFGIDLTEEEKAGIQGLVTEIKEKELAI